MDNEISRESLVENTQSAETIDNQAQTYDSNTSETNGRDLSQIEITDEMRKEYGIPGEYKSFADWAKGYKELNSFRGRRENEFGEIRGKYTDLENKYNQLLQGIQQIGNNKPREEQEREFLDLLSKDPRTGIRTVAEEAYKQHIADLKKEIDTLKNWQQHSQIASEKDAFIREYGISTDEEKELSAILEEKPEFFRRFDSTVDILRAARLELLDRRSKSAPKNTEQAQAPKEKQATVLTTTNARPAKQTGKSMEELRDEIVAGFRK